MRAGKRSFDLVCATAGVLVLAPLFLLVAALVKLQDRGPVFYRQMRVGHRGVPFRLLKFRTMVADADRTGPAITVGHDPRVTRLGAWLRRSKLDELPQLFNVIAGDMSLVGPRPEVPRYVELYDRAHREVLELVPGITDPASIRFASEAELLAAAEDPERAYIECVMPEKIRMNLDYSRRATLWSDIGVILRTVAVSLIPSRRAAAESPHLSRPVGGQRSR